jgi:hypothetical protein
MISSVLPPLRKKKKNITNYDFEIIYVKQLAIRNTLHKWLLLKLRALQEVLKHESSVHSTYCLSVLLYPVH